MSEGLDYNILDRIIKDTMSAAELSKTNLFEITEGAKSVQKRIWDDQEKVKDELKEATKTVIRLESLYKKARLNLIDLSRDLNQHSEEEIKKAYRYAQELQVQLAVERERENNLRDKLGEITRSIERINDMVCKAEELVSKIDIALTFLNGNLTEFSQQVVGIQQKQMIGGRVILAQEEERKRVAREIHDGPAQAMANVVLKAEICEKLLKTNRPQVEDELQELKLLVKDSLQEIRRIIFNLRPMTLDDLGLVPTIKRYLEELKTRENFPVKLEVHGEDRRLKNSYEVALFRLIQEALNNTKKHAQADLVTVIINFLPDSISIQVIDDGKGFHLNKVLSESSGKESFGLLSMRERIDLLNGSLVIETLPGQGTKITVSFPMDQAIYG